MSAHKVEAGVDMLTVWDRGWDIAVVLGAWKALD